MHQHGLFVLFLWEVGVQSKIMSQGVTEADRTDIPFKIVLFLYQKSCHKGSPKLTEPISQISRFNSIISKMITEKVSDASALFVGVLL
jgi:hypothetical protein